MKWLTDFVALRTTLVSPSASPVEQRGFPMNLDQIQAGAEASGRLAKDRGCKNPFVADRSARGDIALPRGDIRKSISLTISVGARII
jgi:hypothetical protein